MRFSIVALSLIGCIGCTSDAERQRQRESQMIEQAKLDAAAESDFVKDSLALAASITVDTVAERQREAKRGIDESGNTFTYTVYSVVSRSGARCLLEPTHYDIVAVNDTLSCQWEPKP